MKIPVGIGNRRDRQEYVLKLKKNLYGLKQAAQVWGEYLKGKLESIGFEQLDVDECLFYRKDVIFMNYVDDGIFMAPNSKNVQKAIDDLKGTGLDLEDRGDIGDYLGINFKYMDNDTIELTQPQIIQQIINQCKLKSKQGPKELPSLTSKILQRHEQESPYDDKQFHY